MARQIRTYEDVSQILDELDISDPQADASKSEDNLEMNLERSDIASTAESNFDSGEEDKFIAKSGKVWRTTVPPVTQRCRHNLYRMMFVLVDFEGWL